MGIAPGRSALEKKEWGFIKIQNNDNYLDANKRKSTSYKYN